ncbi:glycosyltransferase [Arenimonas terrae]|uniref:Glycosyltransferase n=1 Tax=Arenimonas terrae TaxID=2546226 RepID=A0A5C4RRB9_9GAMM|nr:glycosyltransferase [Arenimonas terrae]TNJ33853.1 glycosyltransferase [Arenimonas terrae]
MKIGIVYGHVASNLGDLAINAGICGLLARVVPDVRLQVVLLDPNDTYLDAARASFDGLEHVAITTLNSHGGAAGEGERQAEQISRAVSHALAPAAFLAEAGLEDCSAILYNSGEHLFTHPSRENGVDLLWRLLPMVAAAQQGPRFITLPSTFGPFDDAESLPLLREALGANHALAAREPRSAAVAAALGLEAPVLLDPAFFLPLPEADAVEDSLGIVMRLEEFGLRVGKRRSAHVSASLRKDGFRSSRAYQFSAATARAYLAQGSGRVDLFVQTLADRDMALALAEALQAEFGEARVRVLQPASIAEYQRALARTGFLVSSRFHACILAASLGRPVFGVHFEKHGHKLLGLFELLGVPGACVSLSRLSVEEGAREAMAWHAKRDHAYEKVPARLEKERTRTVAWLTAALAGRRARTDGPAVLRAFVAAAEPLRLEALRAALGESQAQQAKIHDRLENEAGELRAAVKSLAAGMQTKDGERARELTALVEDAAKLRGEMAGVLQQRQDAAVALAASSALVQSLREQVERELSALAAERERAEQLRANHDALRDQSARAQAALDLLRDHLGGEQAAGADLRRQLDEQQAAGADLREQLAGERAAVTAARELAERRQAEVDRLLGQLGQEQAALAATRELAERRQAEVGRLQGQLDQAAAQSVAAREHVQGLEAELAALRARLDAAAQALGSERLQGERLRVERDAIEAARLKLESELQALHSRSAEIETHARREIARLQDGLAQGTAALQQQHEASERRLGELRAELEASSRRQLEQARDDAARALQSAQAAAEAASASHLAEAEDWRQQLLEREDRLASFEQSISFRLGSALVAAGSSGRGALALPRRLAGIVRTLWRRPRIAAEPAPVVETGAPIDREALEAQIAGLLAEAGADAAAARIEALALPGWMAAHLMSNLSKALIASDPGRALALAARAHELEPEPFRAKWLAFRRFDAGDVTGSAALLDRIGATAEFTASEQARVRQIRGAAALLTELPEVPALAARHAAAVPGRVLYVAASTLPHVVSGYTVRTHAMLRSLAAVGVDVHCLMRPGFPEDRGEPASAPIGDIELEGVRYLHAGGPGRSGLSPQVWTEQAARAIEAVARRISAAIIHAASNHENALPALIAARRLGIPFVYEVRGFWEYTAASAMTGWNESERFHLHARLERLVAASADRVLAINRTVAERLRAQGVAAARIAVAPNAVDPARFAPIALEAARRSELGLAVDAPTLAYIGSLVSYEGLDDLLSALADPGLAALGVQLMVVGIGPELEPLQAQAERLGLGPRVRFVGRVRPDRVPELLALADAVVLPRKPLDVCRLVPPIKPLEAMAMARPVLASDLPPLAEMIRDGHTGLLFPAGDPAALAAAIQRFCRDRPLAATMGLQAREWVLAERTWTHVAGTVAQTYRQLGPSVADASLPPAAPPALREPEVVAPGRGSFTAEQKTRFQSLLEQAYAERGTAGVRELALAQGTSPRQAGLVSFCLARAATLCRGHGELDAACELAEEAVRVQESRASLRALARESLNHCRFGRALEVLERIQKIEPPLTDGEEQIRREAATFHGLLSELERLQAGVDEREPAFDPVPGKSVYFLHSSLPHLSGGYATRAHGLISGVRRAGFDIRPYTRPGFPLDSRPELAGTEVPDRETIDGVEYRRILDGAARREGEYAYMAGCVDAFEDVLRRERPAIVHGRSTYLIALPALIAARRVGIPFVYEVSGLWEVVHESRENAVAQKARTERMRLLEGVTVRAADRVVTLTEAMREELLERGVAPEVLSLVPNCVDPDRFVPLPRDAAAARRLGIPDGVPVIGYVGSFMDYEGLDDLVQACDLLAAEGRDFRLLLVGDGAAMPLVQAAVQASTVPERIILTGRVPHDEVGALYSLLDVCPFPRKPWEVCEMVSPMKPFEPLAMGKTVVVSSVRALCDIIEDGFNGRVFRKGDTADLARVLGELIDDPSAGAALGARGKAWVHEHRSWRRAGELMVAQYQAAAGVAA